MPREDPSPGFQSWREFENRHKNVPATVLGNGPSRKTHAHLIKKRGGVIIACNAYWREFCVCGNEDCPGDCGCYNKEDEKYPDYLVCYDNKQISAAIENVDVPIITPGRYAYQDMTSFWHENKHRYWAAKPHVSSPYWRRGNMIRVRYQIDPNNINDMRDRALGKGSQWHPRDVAVGNLSGLLAFQLAILMGCSPILLLGLDVAGDLQDNGDVLLTACEPGWGGYKRQRVEVKHCTEVDGGSFRPKGWDKTVMIWRELTERSGELGQPVFRLVDKGSMTWLPVHDDNGKSGSAK